MPQGQATEGSTSTGLAVSLGQHSDPGRKPRNQDFHGACIPPEPQLGSKGIAVALADGISSSEVSHIASETAVRALLEDYYCTSDAWSVKRSVQRVLLATNSWLHAQTERNPRCYDSDRGYVCTLTAVILKAATLHLFHIGDARLYQVHQERLEQLTEDHRVRVSADTSYLGRALGAQPRVEIDYRSLDLTPGDIFLLATDGVYEHAGEQFMAQTVHAHAGDLDVAARVIVETALRQGSGDNLTVQILRVERVAQAEPEAARRQATALPLPPDLEPGAVLDGYEIVRPLHIGPRSHVHLALEPGSGAPVALKTPASELRDDPAALERFMTEEWVARRLTSPHVLRARPRQRAASSLYVVTEYVEGESLRQWMADHPRAGLDAVRNLVEQVGRGLRAFHRQEMVHQDLRPDNVLVDRTGTARLIDFGAVRVAGLAEGSAAPAAHPLLGTAQYAAPEYFLGLQGDARADVYSLAVITYQMLAGQLPYGTAVAAARTPASQRRLKYRSLLELRRDLPPWLNAVLRKALHPDPDKRHQDVDEFLHDLRHPRREFLGERPPPLIERDPVRFWQAVSALLALALLATATAAWA